MKDLLDPTILRFILVGLINTAVGTSVMYFSYNILDFSYWLSVAANYIIGSVVSFFLNKHFTFQNKEKGSAVVARFILNISLCAVIAYGLTQPLVESLLGELSPTLRDNIAMAVGMVLFTGLNYFGQRFYTFKTKN